MPRLVVPRRAMKVAAEGMELSPTTGGPPDRYQDRLVKYIPAESMAFYAFVDKLLISYYAIDASGIAKAYAGDPMLHVLPWAFLLISLIGTPIYLYRQRIKDQPWRLHAAISTIAFLLWAYTLGGSIFVINGWYHILAAGTAAPLFTFLAGLIEPRA